MTESLAVDAASRADAVPPVLEAVELTKHYRTSAGWPRRGIVHAADQISLALAPGTVTAVVGESGSGKSTLSRLLARSTPATSGRLLLDGVEVDATRRADRAYLAQVQLLLQDPFASLNPVHTVRYTLTRPLVIHRGLSSRQVEDELVALVERVSLSPAERFLDAYPHELSGGQRQRVAIARALAVRPRVLLADEPVSMLDVSIRLGVLNLLGDLRDRDGVTILYVTHDIASARYLADTIAVMYAGQVVESGPAQLVTDAPQHPYTKLLLSAAPDPGSQETRWAGGSGAPPSLVAPPAGCRFHPRCPVAMERCSSESPTMFTLPEDRAAACWLHDSDEPSSGAHR